MTVKEIYKRWKSVIHSHVHVSDCDSNVRVSVP